MRAAQRGHRARGDRRPAVQGQGRAGRRLAWRCASSRARRSTAAQTRLEAPFVGRDDELALLELTCITPPREIGASAWSPSPARAAIGKSRLAWEFLKYIDGLVETRLLASTADQPSPTASGITFWALGEMVRERARLAGGRRRGHDPGWIAETVAAVAAGRAASAAGSRPHCSPSSASAEVPPVGGQHQLFPAWRTFFERIAAAAPVVMVFEDLHWADSGLLGRSSIISPNGVEAS